MAAISCLHLSTLIQGLSQRWKSCIHKKYVPSFFFMTCQGHIKQAAITEWSPVCRDLNEAKTRFDGAPSECKQMETGASQSLYNDDKEICFMHQTVGRGCFYRNPLSFAYAKL